MAEYLSDLGKSDGIALAFFCNVGSTSQKSPKVLDYFIKALVQWTPELFRGVHARYKDRDSTSPPLSIGSLMEILKSITASGGPGKIYLLVDGLEECAPTYIHDLLQSTDQATSHSINDSHFPRILLTCRRAQDTLRWISTQLHLRITSYDVEEDIFSYVDAQIHRIAAFKSFGELDPAEVGQTIKSRADGFFLWTRNVLRALETSTMTGKEALSRSISACPRDLGKYYDIDLNSFPDVSEPDGIIRQAFSLVLVAYRPLTEPALLDALQFLAHFDVEDVDLLQLFRRYCSRLVRLDTEGQLQIVHYTLREHLATSETEHGEWHLQKFHSTMTMACLRLLRAKEVLSLLPQLSACTGLESEVRALIQEYCPLLGYAANSWVRHLADSGNIVEVLQLLLHEFLSNKDGCLDFWYDITDLLSGHVHSQKRAPVWLTLVDVEATNLLPLLQRREPNWSIRPDGQVPLLQDFRCRAQDGWTILHFAASRGSIAFLKFCLEEDIFPVDERDFDNATALNSATANESEFSVILSDFS